MSHTDDKEKLMKIIARQYGLNGEGGYMCYLIEEKDGTRVVKFGNQLPSSLLRESYIGSLPTQHDKGYRRFNQFGKFEGE
jgi:hypothetical protein